MRALTRLDRLVVACLELAERLHLRLNHGPLWLLYRLRLCDGNAVTPVTEVCRLLGTRYRNAIMIKLRVRMMELWRVRSLGLCGFGYTTAP